MIDRFVLLIGAMKAGTTALYRYLEQHPEIAPSRDKEPEVLSNPEFRPALMPKYLEQWDWIAGRHRWALEASTGYTKMPVRPSAALPAFALRRECGAEFRFLYMVRDPIEVIPSTFSLVTGVLEKAFGYSTLPADLRDRYNERLYLACVDLFRYFHEDWTSGRIDRSRVMVVSYDRMMRDFDGLMGEMATFFDMKPTPEQLAAIRKTADEQRAYQSKHSYKLEKYGLSAERIRKDCAFVYETWLT